MSIESPASLSTERVDQIRCQINWLKAERRAEHEQLKKLEHTLSDSVRAESIANTRSKRQRAVRETQKERLRVLSDDINEVKVESRMARTWSGSRPVSPETPVSPGAHKAAGLIADAARIDNKVGDVAQMRATVPAIKSRGLELGNVEESNLEQSRQLSKLSVDALVFNNEDELASHRRDVVRKDLLARVERRKDPAGEFLDGRAVNYFELKLALIDQKLPESEIQGYWELLQTCEASDALEAFKLINLNGSGRICSSEFADGVTRVGCQWQKLTGLRRQKLFFQLFDTDHDGVISLFDLFPTQRHVKKDTGGSTTPDFWKTWVNKNRAESYHLDCPKGRHPPWNTGVADDGLAIKNEREGKDADAKDMRKWMQTTMRRLKGRGKSDARVREMCCPHLPKGTGPKDRQDVPTFSDAELKQCKLKYKDAVMEPQRVVLKALYDLRETRRTLSASRHQLYAVAVEPFLKQEAIESQAACAKSMLGGLHLVRHDH
jgi:hypothetical protein